MKLGISTACFYPLVLEQAVMRIGRLGVRNTEVFVNTESEFGSDYVEALRALLDGQGLQAVSVHPYTSGMEGQLLLSDYARRTEDGLKQYARYFAAAQRLGARFLTFHGERSIIPEHNAADVARKMEVYRRLCALAETYGIVLAQENVAWCKSENPEYLRMLREQVPALGFTLDLKQAHRAGRHWSAYLDAMGDRLVNVHINDFDSTRSCLLPGEGVMDYTAFFARLRGLGYQGAALIEVYASNYTDEAQLARSVRLLDGLWRAKMPE